MFSPQPSFYQEPSNVFLLYFAFPVLSSLQIHEIRMSDSQRKTEIHFRQSEFEYNLYCIRRVITSSRFRLKKLLLTEKAWLNFFSL